MTGLQNNDMLSILIVIVRVLVKMNYKNVSNCIIIIHKNNVFIINEHNYM